MLFVAGGVTIVGLHLLLTKTRLGKMMRATAQNLTGARLIGTNTQRVYDFTLIIASAIAGLAGILMLLISTAYPTMGQPLLLMGFSVVIVAGMGNLKGAVVVGLSLGVMEALFGQYVDTYFRSAFVYAVMVIVLLLRPQGLFGKRLESS